MKYLLFFACVLCIIIVLETPIIRFAKTFFLISQTSPYERHIPEAPKILILGDSTGYGTGVRNPEDSIAGKIASDFPRYSIINNSANGRTINELVPIAKNVTGEYALILLQIGGNDILQKRDVAVVTAELREIITTLSPHTPNLVMMASGNVGGAAAFSGETQAEYESLTRTFRSTFLQLHTETKLVYVDLFVEPEDDIVANNPETYLAIDGLHPTAAGYAVWYETLYPTLSSRLNQ